MIVSKAVDITMPVICTCVSSFWIFAIIHWWALIQHHLYYNLTCVHFGIEICNRRTLASHVSVGERKIFFFTWSKKVLVSNSWHDLFDLPGYYIGQNDPLPTSSTWWVSWSWFNNSCTNTWTYTESYLPCQSISLWSSSPTAVESHFLCCNWFIKVFLLPGKRG